MTDRITEALREAIVTLELPPGAPIDKDALMTRFGASRFPIAAALKRLELEKLVDIRPQSGSRVSLIRLADVHENMFLRRALEAEVAERLCAGGNAALISELRRNLRYQKAAVEANDRPGFHRLDLAFHDLLAATVGFPRVRTAIDNAVLALDRVRRLLDSPRRHALTYDEHVAIVDALEARDPAGARQAMVTHIDAVMSELEAFCRNNPDVFSDATPPGG
jgi:DNA-binding GntR family transcriptional regulator